MINKAKGNKKNGAKTLAIFLIFLLTFQIQSPIVFSATISKIIKPIKPISTATTTTTSTITSVATTTTIAPVSNTTEFFSTSPITETTETIAPVQTVQLAQPVDLTAAVGTISTTINPIDGPATILPIQQISLNTVTAIQPTADIAIGEVSTTINEDGTITVLPTVQSFVPSATTNSTPQVVSNTSGTTSMFETFSAPSEQEGTFENPDPGAFDAETDPFFTPEVPPDNNSDPPIPPIPPVPPDPPIPVNPTTSLNQNPFVPTSQSNTGGGGSGPGGGPGVNLGDGRTPQPTVLNTKLGDFVGGGVLGISEKLAKYFGKQKNKDKKNKKKKMAQGKEETDEKEIQSEEESTMTLVVDGQEIEVQKGQNAELKAKEALKPILKAIQKDSLGNDLKIDVVQDVTSIFSFQSNAVNVVSKPQTQKESIKVIDNSKQVFIPRRQLKTAHLAKRVSPLQFHKIHKLQSIATQEGTFINEFETGVDPDHAFPA